MIRLKKVGIETGKLDNFEILCTMRCIDKSVVAAVQNNTFFYSVTNFKQNNIMIKFSFYKEILGAI